MSKVTSYRLELDALQHPVLVAEKQMEFAEDKYQHPEQIADVCNALFRMEHQAEEIACVAALDNAAHLLGVFQFSHGINNQAFCRPREIFIRALLAGASGICVVHNHTSGDVVPSDEDRLCISQLREVGDMMGISLLDFLIIGRNCYYSAMEAGDLKKES